MHPDTHLVIQLQSLDQRISALDREIATLPKHIAAIEKTLEIASAKAGGRSRRPHRQPERIRKKLDGEIQVHQQKISKLRDQMLGAKTNEQYRAFQHEIEFAEKEIRKAEDRILELMGESEALDQNVKTAEAALKEEKSAVEAEKARARERTASDQAELDQLRAERKDASAKLPASVRAMYDKILKKWNGSVIAEAVGGRCAACQLMIRPQHMQDIKRAEALLRPAKTAAWFLYYNPPVHIEDVARVG